VDKMAKAIIGFKIPITSLDHVFKLSQNRDLISQKSIIEQLGRQGDAGALLIAAEMEKRLKED
jgi:transcriptional regulator